VSTAYSPRACAVAMAMEYGAWVVGAVMFWRYRVRARTHLERTQPETFRDMTGRPPSVD